VAISGCGAVTRLYYGPALRRLADSGAIALGAVFDPDQAAARALATGFDGATVAGSLEGLLSAKPDLVFVASPPGFHEVQASACLEAGADVFCEKPLCLTSDAARRLQTVATRNQRKLWVGLVRRQFPATQAIRDLVSSGAIGRIQACHGFEGGPFRWPVRSQDYFSRDVSGGGVFQDIGTHAVDLLTWWFGPPLDLLYQDDAMGGVEANCRLALKYSGFDATLRLSRDWARPNRYVVRGSLGSIAWAVDEPDRIDLSYEGREWRSELLARPATSQDSVGRRPVVDFHSCFASQLAAAAGRSGMVGLVTVEDAIPTIELIERAYGQRRPLAQPWIGEVQGKRQAG
jgi:predicted dehydrogenase